MPTDPIAAPPRDNRPTMTIVVADDDADDRLLIADAFTEARFANPVEYVSDGEALMQYLKAEGPYADRAGKALPGLILLDLNMPKMDGRSALGMIKGDPALRRIPVVVLTTSKAEEDILRTYDLGVNSFITKPVTFDALVYLVRTIKQYWIELVELPEV